MGGMPVFASPLLLVGDLPSLDGPHARRARSLVRTASVLNEPDDGEVGRSRRTGRCLSRSRFGPWSHRSWIGPVVLRPEAREQLGDQGRAAGGIGHEDGALTSVHGARERAFETGVGPVVSEPFGPALPAQ
jgi:hypothetical protein